MIHPFWIVAVLIVMIAVAVPVAAIVGVTRSTRAPLDILARRLAAGEITAEEYQKARELLQGASPKNS